MVLQFDQCKPILVNRDIELDPPYAIARYTVKDCTVIDLTSGNSITLDIKWIKIFSNFFYFKTEEIVRIKNITKTDLWFVINLTTKIAWNKNIFPLTTLKETSEIRNWFQNEFNLKLEPITYRTRDNILEL